MAGFPELTLRVLKDAQVCWRKAWHRRRGKITRNVQSADKLQEHYSTNFRNRVYKIYEEKGLHMIDPDSTKEDSISQTLNILNKRESPARFVANGMLKSDNFHYLGVCDLMERVEDEGEVKWRIGVFRAGKIKENKIRSEMRLGYLWVIAEAMGINVDGVFMVSVNPNYTLNSKEELTERVDVSTESLGKRRKFAIELREAQNKTGPDTPIPEAKAIPHCKKCELFEECVGKGLERSVWDLPRISGRQLELIVEEEDLDLLKVSPRHLTPFQTKHLQAVKEKKPVVDILKLSSDLKNIAGPPYYYLDFEHMQTVIPNFDGHKPFEQIITQFSLHISKAHLPNDNCPITLSHSQYLSDGSHGSLQTLVQKLVEVCDKSDGAVIVYSSSESTQIRRLIERYPHLGEGLTRLLERIVDLQKILKNSVVHPEFRGRGSLKVVLPALIPEYQGRYESLAISDGAQAVLAFEKMLSEETGIDEKDRLGKDLIEYCALDTKALVALHSRLIQLANPDT
ncbi:hypothetical protein AAMO2058_000216500 [Amorphochlora amoebiformis]